MASRIFAAIATTRNPSDVVTTPTGSASGRTVLIQFDDSTDVQEKVRQLQCVRDAVVEYFANRIG